MERCKSEEQALWRNGENSLTLKQKHVGNTYFYVIHYIFLYFFMAWASNYREM
jgi:hypothetical protein